MFGQCVAKSDRLLDNLKTWLIYDNGDDTCSFINRPNKNKALDSDSCSKSAYIKLKLQDYQFNCGNGDSSKWRIIQ